MPEISCLPAKLVHQTRLAFQQLVVHGPETGDWFFNVYGVGNTQFPDRPYERFVAYEELLEIMRLVDEAKFETLHKGTAYYYLGWTAFQLRDYERAVFYMDAALSEDERKSSNQPVQTWIKNPAGRFLMLDETNQAAPETTTRLRFLLQGHFDRFNKLPDMVRILDIERFAKQFVLALAPFKEARSIVTALYSFVLEFEDRSKMLSLRSVAGGSIEPFLTHLFKGGLIFESLIKHYYRPKFDRLTLGGIKREAVFKNDFCTFDTTTKSYTIKEIISKISNDTIQTAFSTTARLRNTTGHDLTKDDVFGQSQAYTKLCNQVMNSVLFVIDRKA